MVERQVNVVVFPYFLGKFSRTPVQMFNFQQLKDKLKEGDCDEWFQAQL